MESGSQIFSVNAFEDFVTVVKVCLCNIKNFFFLFQLKNVFYFFEKISMENSTVSKCVL